MRTFSHKKGRYKPGSRREWSKVSTKGEWRILVEDIIYLVKMQKDVAPLIH